MSTPFILYVEDDVNDVFILRRELQANSIPGRLIHIRKPQEFSEALAYIEPDLIVADGNVPGFDTAEALKMARERCPLVPFYYLTGTVSEQKAKALLAAGATGCLLKNDPAGVSSAIREALRHQHRNWGGSNDPWGGPAFQAALSSLSHAKPALKAAPTS